VGAVSGPAFVACPVADSPTWIAVTEAGVVGQVRRSAAELGTRIGLPPAQVGRLSIVATELSSNLVKHAVEGWMLIRTLRHGDEAGIELLAVDAGPGMADLAVSRRDGHSTAGTLGIGLGAVARQATWWDGYTQLGWGTVLAAQVWRSGDAPGCWAQGVERPMSGERVCGDAYGVRAVGDLGQVMLCDGLGHGPLAEIAARAAVTAFLEAPPVGPAAVLEHMHRALGGTRGAAALVAELDAEGGVVRCAGLGNIAATVLSHGGTRAVVSLPGIVGHQRRAVRQFDYPMDRDAMLVMHSDGVSTRWDARSLPGMLACSPTVAAASVLRTAGVRRDDASVLVARLP
jgi:anti-sigma regulatory factor (Ser/Thr protein kinase)